MEGHPGSVTVNGESVLSAARGVNFDGVTYFESSVAFVAVSAVSPLIDVLQFWEL